MNIIKNNLGLYIVKENNNRLYYQMFDSEEEAKEYINLIIENNKSIEKGDIILYKNIYYIVKENNLEEITLINMKDFSIKVISIYYELIKIQNMFEILKNIL